MVSLTQSDVVARANALGVPVFTIGTRTFGDRPGVCRLHGGGRRATPVAGTCGVIDDVDRGLRNHPVAPRRRVPGGDPGRRVTDCNPHMLEVTVLGETASAPFVRCDTTPEPLVFARRTGSRPEVVVVSNAVTITSIDSPVRISVHGGEYSLGCRSSFTRAPGIALPGDLVCVRHWPRRNRGTLTRNHTDRRGRGSEFLFVDPSRLAVAPDSGGG